LTLQAHEFVPGPVLLHVALGAHPPLLVWHELTGAQAVPVPEYPGLQAHELVPGPVLVQVALLSQPPLPTAHELIGVHVIPLPP
jgi:hypothetical protein